jgi:hypothetical protein
MQVEHALYGSHAGGGYRFLAKSAEFRDEWLPLAERLCMGFGERPPGVACPACVFAQPFCNRHVSVIQAADQGNDDAGRPGALAFYLVVLPRDAYVQWGGDPFLLADRFPPPWHARGELPSITEPLEPPPARTVAEVQRVLKRDDGPSLLGATQALVDGGHVVFERQTPDAPLLRDLWLLLPTSTRAGLWPASFAFGNDLQFDAVAAPRVNEAFDGYLTDDQAAEYPEGHYERGVQCAAEAGDQRELDALFHRPSRQHMLRLGLALLVAMILIWGVYHAVGFWIAPNPPPAEHPIEIPNLPAPELCHTTDKHIQEQATEELRNLARHLKLDVAGESNPETLLEQIDQRLGTPDPKRLPGSLRQYAPVQRELRALMWKHGMERYDDQSLNTAELAERFRQHVESKEKP